MQELLITNTQIYRPFHPSDHKLLQVRVADGRIVAIEENGYKRGKTNVLMPKVVYWLLVLKILIFISCAIR